MLNLHRGQGIELFWWNNLNVPTDNQYHQMISNKTGGLFRLAVRLMQSVSTTGHNILSLTELIGLIFQIRDDYRDLCPEEVMNVLHNGMTSTKGFCEDLKEGRFPLPVIRSVSSSTSNNNELINILKLHTSDKHLKSYTLSYMQTQRKSLDYTKDFLRQLHQRAQTALGQIQGKNDVMEVILAKLRLD